MSSLTIYKETGEQVSHTENAQEITLQLKAVGIEFNRWQAKYAIGDSMSNEEILNAYQDDINEFVRCGGYQTVDVVSMNPHHPDKKALREKFLSEHRHSEDEIRFFVRGQGLFTLHINAKVYAVLCCKDDLISVPAGTPHWFDMGEHPQFTAIRFFNNPEGWIAKYTDSPIAQNFPLLEPIIS